MLSGASTGVPTFDNFLFYPEGFAGSTITEFVPLGNPNSVDAQYRVIAHFETDRPDQVLAEGSIPAESRGGITVSRAADHSSDLIEQGLAYALEVQSTEPLVASLSHYDFGSATGETFTSRSAFVWAIPELATGAGRNDFVVWYNAGAGDAHLSVRFIAEDGSTLNVLTAATRGKARGGLNLALLAGLPASGIFGAVITADQPIVAAATRYLSSGDQHSASTELGTAGSGATSGLAPLGGLADGASDTITFLDPRQHSGPGGSGQTVTLTFSPSQAGVAPVIRTVAVNEFGLTRFDVASLADELGASRYAVEFSSTVPLVGRLAHHEHGDDAATSFAQATSERSIFADGFMDPTRAGGNVFETVGVGRAAGSTGGAAVRIIAHFADGESASEDFALDDSGAFALDLHAWPRLLQSSTQTGQYFYTIEVQSDIPVAAVMWHYDLTLGGGTPAGGFAASSQPLATAV